MKFIKKPPAMHLAHLVRHYWYLDITEADIPFTQTSFTYGSFDLICYLENPNSMQWLSSGKPFTEPEIFYSGQITKPFLMSFDKPCRCIGAGLYPWAGNVLSTSLQMSLRMNLFLWTCLKKTCACMIS